MKTISLAFVLAASTLIACAQEDAPPELPPVSSIQANLEGPTSAPPAAKNADPEGVSEYTHFANAWVRVKLVQAGAGAVTLIPALVIAAALTQDPVKEGDTWHWSVSAQQSTADLFVSAGLVSGWDLELYVTNAEVDNFLWIEGDFELDLSAGTWTGHSVDLPEGDNEVLAISWTHTSATEHSLTFENVNDSHEDFGDFISYSLSGTTALLVYEDASDTDLIANITWDTQTYAGAIEVPLYNGGEIGCWDQNFVNTTCP